MSQNMAERYPVFKWFPQNWQTRFRNLRTPSKSYTKCDMMMGTLLCSTLWMLIGRRKLVVSPDFCRTRKYLKIDTLFLLSYFSVIDERKFAYLFAERLGLKFVKASYEKWRKPWKRFMHGQTRKKHLSVMAIAFTDHLHFALLVRSVFLIGYSTTQKKESIIGFTTWLKNVGRLYFSYLWTESKSFFTTWKVHHQVRYPTLWSDFKKLRWDYITKFGNPTLQDFLTLSPEELALLKSLSLDCIVRGIRFLCVWTYWEGLCVCIKLFIKTQK